MIFFCQSYTVKNKLGSLIYFWKNMENEETNRERNCLWKLGLLTSRSDSAKNSLTSIHALSSHHRFVQLELHTLIAVPCCMQVYDWLIFENLIYFLKSIGFPETLCCCLIVNSSASFFFFLLQEIAEKMTLAF